MHYYISYKGRRLKGPLTREKAIQELFELKRTFKGLTIIIVDEQTGRVKGEINPGRKRRK